MSRIGNLPVVLPEGVSVSVGKDGVVVKGPNGTMTSPQPGGITCKVDGKSILVSRSNDERKQRALHGLTRALLANAVAGVSKGWSRELEIQGIGYRAAVKGDKVELALGFSHPVVYSIPKGITVKVEKNTRVSISGVDRQKVGQVAAELRNLRPPEPYKGKRSLDDVAKPMWRLDVPMIEVLRQSGGEDRQASGLRSNAHEPIDDGAGEDTVDDDFRGVFVEARNDFDSLRTVVDLVNAAPEEWNLVPPAMPPVVDEGNDEIAEKGSTHDAQAIGRPGTIRTHPRIPEPGCEVG